MKIRKAKEKDIKEFKSEFDGRPCLGIYPEKPIALEGCKNYVFVFPKRFARVPFRAFVNFKGKLSKLSPYPKGRRRKR